VINIFSVLYDSIWTIIIIVSLPLMPLVRQSRLLKRLWPSLPAEGSRKKRLWIHALSVGEVISAVPVIRYLKERYPSRDIALTVTTLQGMEIARKKVANDVQILLPMPLDCWWSMRRLVRYLNPFLFILVETDIWPGLIFFLQRKGVHSFLINGRISPRTFLFYKRFRSLSKRLLGAFELCLMQSDLDRDRLLSIGLSPEKIKTAGNIKFDRAWQPKDEQEYLDLRNIVYLRPESRVWVAGSTHEGEEEFLFDIFKRLAPRFSDLRLIIAPRRIERAEDLRRSGNEKGLRTICRTDLDKDHGYGYQVMVLNTIGELERFYGLAEISFVGGSLVPVGGHNLLEPASFGCPVIFGPYVHNFVLMSQLLVAAGGGIRVKNAEDIYAIMEDLLLFPEKSKEMGARAKEFVEINRGALKRIMTYIEGYIQDGLLAERL
jgi:3-deoxy-D-manno-octulosonic-acid transferase